MNDFGAAGIDGEIFSESGIESVELPSGCICCTLKFDLISAIKKVISEFCPDNLVIEPSGIASPAGVLEALESAGIHSYSVIGIVDVTEFAELYRSGTYGSFFSDQIRLSDVVLVNKVDLTDENNIAEAEKLIASLNSRALLFRTNHAHLHGALHVPLSAAQSHLRESSNLGTAIGKSKHFHLETLSFRLNGKIKLGQFTTFFRELRHC